MKIYLCQSKIPFTAFALEETLLKDQNQNEDILLIYINHNAVIIGRNQNVFEEVNLDVLKKLNITLARRVSGGGAVYHDQGNVNFSYITKKQVNSYTFFLAPIIEFLNSLGLPARFKGKNDLEVDGIKISGNAQYIWKDRMFHHGTLLYDSNLSILAQVLKPHPLKMQSKGIKSARQRVANIKSLLKTNDSTAEFVKKMIAFFAQKGAQVVDFANYKQDDRRALANVRQSYDWNYGKNPQFNIHHEQKFDGGLVIVKIHVVNNKFKSIKFEGDFLSAKNVDDVSEKFLNQPYLKSVIDQQINQITDFAQYFGKISQEEIISTIWGQHESH